MTKNSKSCLKSCQSLSYLKWLSKYDFGLIITNCSVDKILAWPCLWRNMHISAKIQDGGKLADLWFFSVKISQEIIKLRKIGKGDLHIILKVLPNEIIKNMLPYPFNYGFFYLNALILCLKPMLNALFVPNKKCPSYWYATLKKKGGAFKDMFYSSEKSDWTDS
jgi:hypothetical protein